MIQSLDANDRYPNGRPDPGLQPQQPGHPAQGTGLLRRGARGYLERVLAMRESLYAKDRYPQGHPDLANSLNNLGSLLQDQGSYMRGGGTTSVRWR